MLISALDALQKYLAMGGYVMPPLVLATMALWFGLGSRMSILRRGRALEPRRALSLAEKGELRAPKSAIERAALLGMQEKLRGMYNLQGRLDDALNLLLQDLGRYRALTASVVAVAPLLGLLGTVSGMIETFASLGDNTLYSQSGGIASGISQALLTTQFGLTIAIPGLMMGGYLDRRQRVVETQIDEMKSILVADKKVS